MRIKDLLKVEAIELGVSAANKEAAIDKLVALHDKVGNLADVEGYKAAILKRESESTTAIGEGLAVPPRAWLPRQTCIWNKTYTDGAWDPAWEH